MRKRYAGSHGTMPGKFCTHMKMHSAKAGVFTPIWKNLCPKRRKICCGENFTLLVKTSVWAEFQAGRSETHQVWEVHIFISA